VKKFATFTTIIAIMAVTALATDTLAQQGMRWRGSGGWGPGTKYGGMYDPKSLETVSGQVVKVDKITPIRGMSYGVHLILKTDQGDIPVHLGPGWFIENQDMKIEPKDKLEIKGSKIAFEGKPVIIAAEIKKGSDVLKLRDEDGYPFWAGWRRR
jgi:hypothetical protein